jgi:L-iditol 2-dehydrogenase
MTIPGTMRASVLTDKQTIELQERPVPTPAADAFIECSGATPALVAGLQALRGGGTAVLVGLGAEEISLPVQLIATRELVLTGVFRYVDTWPKAIAAAQQPGTDIDGLVTAEFDLEDTEAALTSDADPASMKSIVVVSRA